MEKAPYRVRPEDMSVFKHAIEHNRQTLKEQLPNNSIQICRYWFAGLDEESYVKFIEPGRRDLSYFRKQDDLIPSAILGAIPFATLNGDDSLMLHDDGAYEPIEVKLALVNRNLIWSSPDRYFQNGNTQPGSLYMGKSNTENGKSCLASKICGSYQIKHNLNSKNVSTFLVVIEDQTSRVIGCYGMPGNKVIERLTVNRNTGKKRMEKVSKISIKLNAFQSSDGFEVKADFPMLGYRNWYAELKAECPVLKVGEYFNK